MKLLINYCLLLISVIGCAHNYQHVPGTTKVAMPCIPVQMSNPPVCATELTEADPATLPVEIEKPEDVIVLDRDTVKGQKNYFKLWEGLTTSKEALEKLIPVANCILNDPGFLAEMKSKKFTFTDKSGEQVVSELQNSGTVSTVSTYRNSRFSPFTTLAYTDNKTIYMNTRYKFQALTLVHEHFHSLGFSHRNAKDWQSVPYQAGINGEKYMEKCR